MTQESDSPQSIYLQVARDVEHILTQFDIPATDAKLAAHLHSATEVLAAFKTNVDHQIQLLDRNAEWDVLTIAFYGETNAGKSTIIEALRILLGERTKREAQQAFRQIQQQYGLTETEMDALAESVRLGGQRLAELQSNHVAMDAGFGVRETNLSDQIARLQVILDEKSATFWQRLMNRFKRPPELALKALAEADRQTLQAERHLALQASGQQVVDTELRLTADQRRQASLPAALERLVPFADGGIIGDGRSDYTVATKSYSFQLGEHSCVLLDVPGIEGNEGKVREHIESAVQTAHVVFYVTSKAAAPQKGDGKVMGTLEKIARQLGPQTEVWTLYNKRATSPRQLQGASLTTNDEEGSLKELDRRVGEQLGESYRGTRTLSAYPMFLASAEHLVPESDMARQRQKFLDQIPTQSLLEKSGFNALESFLTTELVDDCKAKIKRSNFNKAREVVCVVAEGIGALHREKFEQLGQDLVRDAEGACRQIDLAVKSMKSRVRNAGRSAIDHFERTVREEVYVCIDRKLGNDDFKRELRRIMEVHSIVVTSDITSAVEMQSGRLKDQIGEVIERFKEQAEELLLACRDIHLHQIHGAFELKINIDSGIQVGSLLASLIGGILLIWNPMGWALLIPSALTLVFSIGKAVWAAINTDYRKSQQRKVVDDNLKAVASQMSTRLSEALDEAFGQLGGTVKDVKASLHAPVAQVELINQVLASSVERLERLSAHIHAQGSK
ncbi:MAG: hypothetical protein ABI114_16855 [Rhodanobacter sp.]